MESTRKTYLYEEHVNLGAKMFSFAGWEMPLQYTSMKEEHLNVRENAGLFDVSHMGQVFVSGEDSLAYLQNLVPRDLSELEIGKAAYSELVNARGGIIDDLIIYRISSNKYMLIINASRVQDDVNWLTEGKKDYNITIDNQSENFCMIALQGPKAIQIIEKMGIGSIPARFGVAETNLAGVNVILARTGYTGEDGFEIVVKNEHAVKLWKEILDNGQEFGLKPTGYGARDTLRLEAFLHLYGQDMDETTTPIEASLGWTISKDKKEDYPGKDVILQQMQNNNYAKKLVRFKMLDRSVPRHDYEIFIDNENAGRVTSGGFSPSSNIGIGLGYVDTKKNFTDGTKIEIMIREKLHPAEIIKTPLYR